MRQKKKQQTPQNLILPIPNHPQKTKAWTIFSSSLGTCLGVCNQGIIMGVHADDLIDSIMDGFDYYAEDVWYDETVYDDPCAGS